MKTVVGIGLGLAIGGEVAMGILSAFPRSLSDPPHGMIEMSYFKCVASKNLAGGIWGKGPFKRFGPERSACAKSDWVRIDLGEFRELATEWYGFDWSKEGGWWNRSVLLTRKNFRAIHDFILQRGDRRTYCNRYNDNPHYRFDGFDAFLNPDVGQKNIDCDPRRSGFDELVVYDRSTQAQYFTIKEAQLAAPEPGPSETGLYTYFERMLAVVRPVAPDGGSP